MRIKYDADLIGLMNLFQKTTGTNIKDCFIDNNGLLTFVVPETEIAKAIGKKGINARSLERSLNRKIKIVEFNPDVLQFVKNVIYPLKVKDIQQEEGIITLEAVDTNTRGLLIGRNAKNLRNTESTVKRYFNITEIKVIEWERNHQA